MLTSIFCQQHQNVRQSLLGCITVRCDSSPETQKLTLAHHRVSSSSVVRASDQITEGRGFKSHLRFGFFSEFSLPLILSYYYSIFNTKIKEGNRWRTSHLGEVEISISWANAFQMLFWCCLTPKTKNPFLGHPSLKRYLLLLITQGLYCKDFKSFKLHNTYTFNIFESKH